MRRTGRFAIRWFWRSLATVLGVLNAVFGTLFTITDWLLDIVEPHTDRPYRAEM